jgi:hypothetical protein
MYEFEKLTDEDIHWLWSKELVLPSQLSYFKMELVRRGFVTWEEINTKWKVE